MKSRPCPQRVVLSMVALVTVHGCVDRPAPTEPRISPSSVAPAEPIQDGGSHIVLFEAEELPADLEQRVSMLHGSVEIKLGAIGVAVVAGLSPTAAARLESEPDVRAVERHAVTAVGPYGELFREAADILVSRSVAAGDATTTTSPATAQLYARQWNLRAVSVPDAWAAGHLGSREVVVAILDTGIDYLHPDLIGLVDLDRSISLAPEDDLIIAERYPGRRPFSDLNGHGTAVASVVASNAQTLAGVSRHVTLLAVKVFDRTFQGPAVGRLIAGIVYAADQGADVINISRADTFNASENPGIVIAINRAAQYAFRQGALIVSIADNDAADLDRDGARVKLPCEAVHVICVSATGPTAAAGINGPWENVDARSPYSAFGRSAIDVAAPGGAGDMANQDPVSSGTQFRRIWAPCTTTPTESSLTACVRRLPVAQPFGTSFAAPHVSGLAALLVAQRGHNRPAEIRARILESADDLGEGGKDPVYGHGRINIARALGVTPLIDNDKEDQ